MESQSRITKKGDSQSGTNARWLFFVDTPYQIFNSIAFIDQVVPLDHQIDFVVISGFRKAESIIRRLSNYERVGNVYPIESYSAKEAKTKFEKVRKKIEVLLGKKTISDEFFPSDWNYSYVVYGCPQIVFSEIMQRISSLGFEPQIIMLDEGTGSYDGNVFRYTEYIGKVPFGVDEAAFQKRLLKKALRLFGLDRAKCEPDTMYLHRSDLVTYYSPFRMQDLIVTDRALAVSERVFCDSAIAATEFAPQSVVIFDSVRVSSNAMSNPPSIEVVDELRARLSESGREVLLKLHPLTKFAPDLFPNESLFPDVHWEVFCGKNNVNGYTLIGAASTAMITPALIHKANPRLIFLPSNPQNAAAGQLSSRIVAMANSLYIQSPERVCVAVSIDEAMQAI